MDQAYYEQVDKKGEYIKRKLEIAKADAAQLRKMFNEMSYAVRVLSDIEAAIDDAERAYRS